MQTAGTLRGTRAISFLALLVLLIGYAHSSPLQYLPSISGYVPVYIRYGDEPLEEINPDLAEAFGETSNSIKNLQKLDTLVRESDNFKDDDIDAFLQESKRKHIYPLHVRETSRSFATVNDEGPGSNNPNKPKLLTIYELPDDNENRIRTGRGRARARLRSPKLPASKVSPLSDAEKDELKKLAIEVEKEETKPNNLYMPSSKDSELSRGTMHNRHNTHNFGIPMKVQNPLESSADLPEVREATDISESSNKDDIAIPESDKGEPPIKEQRPATILSNVAKLSPIDFPDKSETSGDVLPEAATSQSSETASSEIPQIIDLLEDDPSQNHDVGSEDEKKEPPIKVQRPSTILSNVDKLSPIDLPQKSDENNKKKDSIERNDEIGMD